MTTTQKKWWWPIFSPWKMQQTFKQKMLASCLCIGYLVVAILSTSSAKILGDFEVCVPKQTDASTTIINSCNEYDGNKTTCTTTGICTVDVDRGVLFGIYFFWVIFVYMFVGVFISVIYPQLRGIRKSRQTVSPAIPSGAAITPMEYDAL